MKLLYVNDRLVDLHPNTVIAQTLQVFDPGRLGSVVLSYTSAIRAPRTFNNDITFGQIWNSKTKSNIPFESLSCKYIENGILLIREGTIRINEVNESDYSLTIYSGPFGFFEVIQDKTLWDLNFLDINGPWSQAARDGYRNAVTGILQALVDDGRLVQDQVAVAPTIENQGSILKPPQVYYHTIVEKVFSSFGFEFEGDIFDNAIFKNIALPLSLIYNDPSFLESKMFFAAAPGTQQIVDPVVATEVIFTVNVKQGSENFYDGVSKYIISNPDTPLRYFRLSFYFDLTIEVAGGTVDIQIEATGYTPTVLLNKGSGTYTSSFLSSLGHADTDIVKVTIIKNTGTPVVDIISGQFYTVSLTGKEGLEFLPSIVPAYVYFNKLFEEILLIDFLKDFCVRFNVQITQINNKIICNTLNLILDDRTGPDWTLKRDKGPNKIKYLFANYGRTNLLKSPIDTDFTPDLTDNYGDGSFEIPNENLRESSTIYTSIYQVTQMVSTFGVFMLKLNLEPNLANFARMPGNRLFFVRQKYDFEPPVLYDVIEREDYTVAYFFDANQPYEMSWQFFIDNFHRKFIDRCLRSVKVIQRQYNLNDLDIYAFNQQVPIWDNGERFLVTKIINRVSGRVVKVDLLKIDPNPAVTFVENIITAALIDTMELMGAVSIMTDTMEEFDADINNIAPLINLSMQLTENVTGNPTWQTTFDNVVDNKVLSCLGNFSQDNNTLDDGTPVDADVIKTNNDGNGPDGFTTNSGWVEWLRNGVQEHTEAFANGVNLTYSYTYVGVAVGDELLVIVHEDGTSP